MFESISTTSLILKDFVKYSLKTKSNFNKLIDPFQEQINDLLTQYSNMIKIYSIDNASGAGLDFIGLLIGQYRITSSYSNGNFVFDSNDNGFDIGLFDNGGSFISDEYYKRFLKATVLKKNIKNWCRDDFINYYKLMIGDTSFSINEDNGTVTVTFNESLGLFENQILGEFPLKILGITIIHEGL